MAELADAFIALPGGFSTVEEFCEAVTWTQLGLHRKRCGLLNVDGFYDRLAMMERAVEDDFIRHEGREIVVADDDPARLLDRLAAAWDGPREKWLRSLTRDLVEPKRPRPAQGTDHRKWACGSVTSPQFRPDIVNLAGIALAHSRTVCTMEMNRAAVGVIAAVCVAAGAGGAYLATDNASAVPVELASAADIQCQSGSIDG